MSRGISRQQQRILGLAVAISRHHNGEPVPRVPAPHPRYRIPVVQDKDIRADIWTAIAAHILGGVALRAQKTFGQVFLETTPTAFTTRNITARALTSLLKRELLALIPNHVRGTYCLTAAGLAAGPPHEPAIADLGQRLWLMSRRTRPSEHPEWLLPWNGILPSPEIAWRRGTGARKASR